jgi:hypothetical protein
MLLSSELLTSELLSMDLEMNGPRHDDGLMNGPSRDPLGSLKLKPNHLAIIIGVFQCIKSTIHRHQCPTHPWAMDIVHDFLTLAAFYLLGVCMEIMAITVHTDGFSVMVVEFNQ